MSTAIVFYKETALDALSQLGIPPSVLRKAMEEWAAARDSATGHHPPNWGGFNAWAQTVRSLRDDLTLQGWTKSDEPQGLALVVSPDKRTAIAVLTGDESTGITERNPQTKHPRGAATYDIIETNQIVLFEEFKHKKPSGPFTWFLLIHMAKDSKGSDVEVRAELSLPRYIDEAGWIVSWERRIILEPIDLSPSPTPTRENPDDTTTIDVPVLRKTS